jgi:hypothetical protein
MSEIRTDTINNASGDNDSGIDLSTNDQVKIKTANTTAVTVDASQNVTFAGNISNASGDFTLDVANNIILDSGDGDFEFKDTGTTFLNLYESGNIATFYNPINDGDIRFQGKDNTSVITALTLDMSDAGAAIFNNDVRIPDDVAFECGASADLQIFHENGGANNIRGNNAHHLDFSTNNTFRMRLKDDGALLVAQTANNTNVVGHGFLSSGFAFHTVDGGQVLSINRQSDDGTLISLRQANTEEGTISSSGSTISYNAFSGSHWSRLANNSKPIILKGTIIETIDEMCDWYQVTFTVPATDEKEEYTLKVSYALQDGQNVGDTITYNYEGKDYQATIIQEADNKHTKCKISDTADSTRVYGVFADWDNDDDTVNDMYVTAVGTHVVRVHSSATVSAGDLLSSNGDGTAKVQDDDIIRSKTIGKVLTNIIQETYDDGSYTVPCALYCG